MLWLKMKLHVKNETCFHFVVYQGYVPGSWSKPELFLIDKKILRRLCNRLLAVIVFKEYHCLGSSQKEIVYFACWACICRMHAHRVYIACSTWSSQKEIVYVACWASSSHMEIVYVACWACIRRVLDVIFTEGNHIRRMLGIIFTEGSRLGNV